MQVVQRVSNAEYGFSYHPPIELVRNIHHVMAEVLLAADSRVEAGEKLAPIAGDRLLLLPNPLSYADANHRIGK